MQITSDNDTRVGLIPHRLHARMSDRGHEGIKCVNDSVCEDEQGFSYTVDVRGGGDHERRWTCHSLLDVIHCFIKRSSDVIKYLMILSQCISARVDPCFRCPAGTYVLTRDGRSWQIPAGHFPAPGNYQHHVFRTKDNARASSATRPPPRWTRSCVQ